jgi:hypothetical protein
MILDCSVLDFFAKSKKDQNHRFLESQSDYDASWNISESMKKFRKEFILKNAGSEKEASQVVLTH